MVAHPPSPMSRDVILKPKLEFSWASRPPETEQHPSLCSHPWGDLGVVLRKELPSGKMIAIEPVFTYSSSDSACCPAAATFSPSAASSYPPAARIFSSHFLQFRLRFTAIHRCLVGAVPTRYLKVRQIPNVSSATHRCWSFCSKHTSGWEGCGPSDMSRTSPIRERHKSVTLGRRRHATHLTGPSFFGKGPPKSVGCCPLRCNAAAPFTMYVGAAPYSASGPAKPFSSGQHAVLSLP